MTRSSELIVHGAENIGFHYAETLRQWRERFLANRDAVLALGYDERFVRAWEFYLAFCEAAFPHPRAARLPARADPPLQPPPADRAGRAGDLLGVAMDGKVVWITGASSGIGAEVARELARRGARVAATARSADALAALAAGRARACSAHPGDITDARAMERVAAEIALVVGPHRRRPAERRHLPPGAAAEFTADAFRPQVEVNIMGTVNCIQAVLPDMLARRSGRIAVVASVTGFAALPMAAAYGATKAFLISMCESLRADLQRRGHRAWR